MMREEMNVARAIHHPSSGDVDLATVLRTLGDPGRLTILRALAASGEQTCGELQERVAMPVSTCSYHLRLLREAGVTRTRASGTTRFVSLRRADLDDRFPGLLAALAADAAMLEPTP